MLCAVPLGSLCLQILGFPPICLRHKTGSLGASCQGSARTVRTAAAACLMCLLVARTGLAPMIMSQACPPPSGLALLGWYRWASNCHGAFEIRRLPRAGPQDGQVGLPIRGATPIPWPRLFVRKRTIICLPLWIELYLVQA